MYQILITYQTLIFVVRNRARDIRPYVATQLGIVTKILDFFHLQNRILTSDQSSQNLTRMGQPSCQISRNRSFG